MYLYFAQDKFVKITLTKFQSKTNSQIYPAQSIYLISKIMSLHIFLKLGYP
jgi:hypothetical protein